MFSIEFFIQIFWRLSISAVFRIKFYSWYHVAVLNAELQKCLDKFVNYSIHENTINNRSSRSEVFCENGFLENITKFTGKYLCQSLLFDKVAGLRSATLLKKILWHRCFPVNFVKFLRTIFFMEHLWWLLLNKTLPIIIKIISVNCRMTQTKNPKN